MKGVETVTDDRPTLEEQMAAQQRIRDSWGEPKTKPDTAWMQGCSTAILTVLLAIWMLGGIVGGWAFLLGWGR